MLIDSTASLLWRLITWKLARLRFCDSKKI